MSQTLGREQEVPKQQRALRVRNRQRLSLINGMCLGSHRHNGNTGHKDLENATLIRQPGLSRAYSQLALGGRIERQSSVSVIVRIWTSTAEASHTQHLKRKDAIIVIGGFLRIANQPCQHECTEKVSVSIQRDSCQQSFVGSPLEASDPKAGGTKSTAGGGDLGRAG